MRLVFYALLILNLVYLAVALLRPADQSAPPAPPGEAATASLVLLVERPQVLRGEPRNGAQGGGELCLVLGPWGSRDQAQRGLTQLRAVGQDGLVRSLQVQRERLSWVYLPPYGSRDQALRVLRELQSLGVDSFVVEDGENNHAISLGYFSSPASAEGLRLKMRSAGYPAFVRETSKLVTEYWLYLRDHWQENGAVIATFLQGNPDLKQDRAACPKNNDQ